MEKFKEKIFRSKKNQKNLQPKNRKQERKKLPIINFQLTNFSSNLQIFLTFAKFPKFSQIFSNSPNLLKTPKKPTTYNSFSSLFGLRRKSDLLVGIVYQFIVHVQNSVLLVNLNKVRILLDQTRSKFNLL
jgi:hypothetical protein